MPHFIKFYLLDVGGNMGFLGCFHRFYNPAVNNRRRVIKDLAQHRKRGFSQTVENNTKSFFNRCLRFLTPVSLHKVQPTPLAFVALKPSRTPVSNDCFSLTPLTPHHISSLLHSIKPILYQNYLFVKTLKKINNSEVIPKLKEYFNGLKRGTFKDEEQHRD
jgi:hypothetical protein